MNSLAQTHTASHPLLALLLAAALFAGPVSGADKPDAGHPMDPDLVPVEDPRVAMAYIDPRADFSVFKRVAILEPMVAFRSNWQRDQNRSRTNNVSNREMQRIKQDVATLFERVFTERLEAAGFPVVDIAGEDVLILRPAIVDLDITAPDVRTAGRSRTLTTSTGAATMYMELFDSLTGEMIGRAADRQVIRGHAGSLSWSNSVTNRADAQRMFGRWADRLVKFLQDHYQPKK